MDKGQRARITARAISKVMCNVLEPRHFNDATSSKEMAVVVTGESPGIAQAIAHCLVENGARVIICGRHELESQDALTDHYSAGEAHGTVADLSNQEDVKKFFTEVDWQHDQIDILINTAASDDDSSIKQGQMSLFTA